MVYQTIVGERKETKTKISPFPATHTYIKLTLVSFFLSFVFLHLFLNMLNSPYVGKPIRFINGWIPNTYNSDHLSVVVIKLMRKASTSYTGGKDTSLSDEVISKTDVDHFPSD